MLEPVAVEECSQCLAGAAVHEGGEAELALAATALARDLLDTHGDDAPALLEAASREATGRLDVADLDARAFAAALGRVASIRDRATRLLTSSGSTAGLAR